MERDEHGGAASSGTCSSRPLHRLSQRRHGAIRGACGTASGHGHIALLPINGRAPSCRVAGNLSGCDAAQLAKDIGAKIVIPCHYDMFEFNTADPADEFVPECQRLGQPYRVLQLGERFSSTEIPA